jgi:hypothetical protein
LASALAVAPWLVAVSAQAGIVAVSGMALQIAAPASVVINSGLQSDTSAFVFSEQQGVPLAANALVDATASGTYTTASGLTPGSIGIGTRVNSHYLHADRLGSPASFVTFSGSITFDADILGVAALNSGLDASRFLGAAGTNYSGIGGLELINQDQFTISADRRTLSFSFLTSNGSDDLRIITAVPEPGALAMMCTMLGALALVRRKTA